MVKLEAQAVIHRPLDDVFDFYIDPTNRVYWSGHVLSGSWIVGDGPALGSVFQITTRQIGRPVRTERKIIVYEPGRKMCYEIHSGFTYVKSCQTFEPHPDGTLFRITGEMKPLGLLRLVFPFAAKRMVAHVQEEADNLKRALEKMG